MWIDRLFSKQQKKQRGEIPDVFQYDDLPREFRVKVLHILRDAMQGDYDSGFTLIADRVNRVLTKEYGRFALADNNTVAHAVHNFFMNTDVEEALDVIQVAFAYIEEIDPPGSSFRRMGGPYLQHDMTSVKLVDDLNARFREHGVGYEYHSGQIIKVDSTYTHSQITLPALALLNNQTFAGANEEYLRAHEHYMKGNNKECLAECLKAYESTMKVICKEKNWAFDQHDTARKLVQICFANNLVPSWSQNQFTSLQNLIESGVPTVRNKLGGHGQGQVPQKVDDDITRYALNLTGSNIIFLIERSGI